MVQEKETIKLTASRREKLGSHKVRRLRSTGLLPGIVYNIQGQSQSIQLQRHSFEMLLRRHAGENLIIDLEIEGGQTRKVLVKALQRDNIKDNLMHVDFLEISMTRKLRVPVVVKLVGTPVGVTQQDGVLEHLLRTVEVECLPMDIVKEFTLDISEMKIGDSLFVRDIKAGASLTIMTAPDIAIVSVLEPHVEEEAKPTEAGEEAAAAEAAGEKKEGEEAAAKDDDKHGKDKEQAKAEGKEQKSKGKQ